MKAIFNACREKMLVWQSNSASTVKVVNVPVIKSLFLNCYLVSKKVNSFEPLVVTSSS